MDMNNIHDGFAFSLMVTIAKWFKGKVLKQQKESSRWLLFERPPTLLLLFYCMLIKMMIV
ncbi:hypothetical protein DERF_004669 [Dermatophagoides farinae]|uniref:Uncharacterized protein n=1 Tax=Dermatophagoides farinae TaxID=6954 RepID=A0A922I6M1_DERFA|nr:hypothetical protein DERF_004669 [Dermatophagoides farinae]